MSLSRSNLRKLPALFLCCALALPHSLSAFAQEVNCSNAQTQFELNECSFREWQEVDKALNDAWKVANRAMKQRDDQLPEELRGAARSLLEGQRGWIAYRDGQCATEQSEVAGGSMAPMVRNLCLTRLTKARTQELLQIANSSR